MMGTIKYILSTLGLMLLAVLAILLSASLFSTTDNFTQNVALLIGSASGVVGFFFVCGLAGLLNKRYKTQEEPQKKESHEVATEVLLLTLGIFMLSLIVGAPMIAFALVVVGDVALMGTFVASAAVSLLLFWFYIVVFVLIALFASLVLEMVNEVTSSEQES